MQLGERDTATPLSIRTSQEIRALICVARHGVDFSRRLRGQQAEDCHFLVTQWTAQKQSGKGRVTDQFIAITV